MSKKISHTVMSEIARKGYEILQNSVIISKNKYCREEMPPKIRQLKAELARAGFAERPAKGSHTFWTHPALSGVTITIAGKDGTDAQKYQIKQVREALKSLRGLS